MQTIINIDVPVLDTAIDFYCEALGLSLNRTIDGSVAELSGASPRIYLLENPPGSSPTVSESSIRQYTRHWTPVHLDFIVDNLEAAAKKALAAGALQENDCVVWRGSRCITFSDPFGHGFCLIEFEGNTYTSDLANKRNGKSTTGENHAGE